jgi:hypothetical protein
MPGPHRGCRMRSTTGCSSRWTQLHHRWQAVAARDDARSCSNGPGTRMCVAPDRVLDVASDADLGLGNCYEP